MKIKKNWLEWTVFASSLALLLCVTGYLLYATTHRTDKEVRLRVVPRSAQAMDDYFIVPIDIFNDGGTTAETVQVEVTVQSASNTKEVSEITVPFVPRRSMRQAFVAFKTSSFPPGNVRWRIVSYEAP